MKAMRWTKEELDAIVQLQDEAEERKKLAEKKRKRHERKKRYERAER